MWPAYPLSAATVEGRIRSFSALGFLQLGWLILATAVTEAKSGSAGAVSCTG